MKVVLLLLFLPLCFGQKCPEGDCLNFLDIPLMSKLEAPLKAELDISLLINQLRRQLKNALTASLTETVPETIQTMLNERMVVVNQSNSKFSTAVTKTMNDFNDTLHAALNEFSHTFNNNLNDMKKHLDEINKLLDQIPHASRPRDCTDLDERRDKSGVYKIYPDNGPGFNVYCNMTAGNKGWTVLIKRCDGSESFERNWVSYENGFGNLSHEFWLGNKLMHRLTSTGNFKLQVDLQSFKGEKAYAQYSNFGVGNDVSKYKLSVSGYTGTAGDSLTYHNGRPFTTGDQDNEENLVGNCASAGRRKGSGWWYGGCELASLTLQYGNGSGRKAGELMQWEKWSVAPFSIKSASMMIQRL